MKPPVFLFLLILISVALGPAAVSQTNRSGLAPDAKRACAFDIVGLWRSDETTQANPIFFNFSPEGWVSLLKYAADTLPQDLEILTTVNYKLDKPAAPKQIEFVTSRGNDAFPPGITFMDVIEYSDDSFTTQVPASGQQTRWVRERTHRYFLTLAARRGTLPQGGPAFAMLTVLDGRQPPNVEALGIEVTNDAAGVPVPVFATIPAEVYERVAQETDDKKSRKDKKSTEDETVMMRLELTAAEFEKTNKVFGVWSKRVKTQSLPNTDPYVNGLEFFRKIIEPLDKCGDKVKLDKLDSLVTKDDLHHRPIDFIRVMRKRNEDLHVKDSFFPWGWRPMLQLSGQ
ncbi:MAG TPA: hypothetical protein VLM38_19640 [Blastocatellia bacterium]|nr:hypothetical protein [Blastocatellia bacterium]